MTKKKKHQRYTEEFKTEVLRALDNRGSRSVEEVASSFGVSTSVLYGWKAKSEPSALLHDRGETLEQEVRRLRRELADVKKDREVLVKSIAVFVKERK